MTTKIADLIDNFSNGKLPTGENFADLITSMVHRDTFDAHVRDFEDFKARGQIQLGEAPHLWQIGADADGQLRVLRTDAAGKPPATDETGDILLGGWTTLQGRIGARIAPDAFAGPETQLAVAGMASVASDGAWHDIVQMPGHPCAFEITAATARPVYPESGGIGTALRALLGIAPEENGIVHGTCVATGGNRKPALSLTGQPDGAVPRGVLGVYGGVLAGLVLGVLLLAGTEADSDASLALARLAALIEAGAASLLGLLRIDGIDPAQVAVRYVPLTVLALNGLFVLRMGLQAVHLQRRAVRLRWKKTSGSTLKDNQSWTLQLRGPRFPPGPSQAEVAFTLTRLWA